MQIQTAVPSREIRIADNSFQLDASIEVQHAGKTHVHRAKQGIDLWGVCSDLHALMLNDPSQFIHHLISLPDGVVTYAQQVDALLLDRRTIRLFGHEPDGYIDRLLVAIAEEGAIELPPFVNPNRSSVFD